MRIPSMILALALAGCASQPGPTSVPGEAPSLQAVVASTSLREQAHESATWAFVTGSFAVEQEIGRSDLERVLTLEDNELRAYAALQQVRAAETDEQFITAMFYLNITLDDLYTSLAGLEAERLPGVLYFYGDEKMETPHAH